MRTGRVSPAHDGKFRCARESLPVRMVGHFLRLGGAAAGRKTAAWTVCVQGADGDFRRFRCGYGLVLDELEVVEALYFCMKSGGSD